MNWIDIPVPDPDYVISQRSAPTACSSRAGPLGAAKFNRLEGCWWSQGSVFFVSTSGGDVKNGDVNADGFEEGFGQVWEYRQHGRHGGRLVLHYESPGDEVLDSPDNLTVTPRGGLLLCEDDASGTADANRIIGLSPDGEAFVFGVNVHNASELAGVCFSPDGDTMFVNVYGLSTGTPEQRAGQGMTCAITGPWRRGPL